MILRYQFFFFILSLQSRKHKFTIKKRSWTIPLADIIFCVLPLRLEAAINGSIIKAKYWNKTIDIFDIEQNVVSRLVFYGDSHPINIAIIREHAPGGILTLIFVRTKYYNHPKKKSQNISKILWRRWNRLRDNIKLKRRKPLSRKYKQE